MSTIDEIMEAVFESQDAATACEAEVITGEQLDFVNDALRDMITAAIAEARREGAEAMLAEVWIPIDSAPKDGTVIQLFNSASELRDIGHWYTHLQGGEGEWNQELGNGDMTHWRPLPTSKRQAVRLTDEQIARALCVWADEPVDEINFDDWLRHPDGVEFVELSRAIESVVLAANGLGDAK